MVPTGYLLENSQQWVQLAQTGKVSVTGRAIGFYRPSAFFLEPSHMFTYLVAPLFYELLSPIFGTHEKRLSIFLTIGMVLSTSGMGIVTVLLVWLLFIAKRGKKNNKFSLKKFLIPRNLFILFAAIILFASAFLLTEFLNKSVMRIISSGSDYRNAVEGRIVGGTNFIMQLSGLNLLIGLSDHYTGLDFHMTGFNATMYKYGIIGTALSYIFYLRCIIDLKNQFFWLAITIVGLSFFNPHTHGTFYMLFFIVFFLEGYREKRASINR